jgi:hypothetical protein
MPTILETLESVESDVVAGEFAEGKAEFATNWRDPNNAQRNRLISVLERLNDLPCADLRIWPLKNNEVAVTIGETRFVWVSFTGYTWHMWTNFGCEESDITNAGMFSFNDEDKNTANMVVQITRDYLSPSLKATAEVIAEVA